MGLLDQRGQGAEEQPHDMGLLESSFTLGPTENWKPVEVMLLSLEWEGLDQAAYSFP